VPLKNTGFAPAATAQSGYDNPAGKVQSSVGTTKDAIASAASSLDFSALRDEMTTLSQTVSDLVQKQASTTRDQVMGVVAPLVTTFRSLLLPPRISWFLCRAISKLV
jgi:hypothetical protein